MLILRAERYMRQAHNLKVAGSNPAPATNHTNTFLILDKLRKFFHRTIAAIRLSFLEKWAQYRRNEKSPMIVFSFSKFFSFFNMRQKCFHFNLFLTLFSHFKRNLILNEHQMRFSLFYTFIFLYWTVLILGPFIN